MFFAPLETDYQTAHDENEFYLIARGGGKIVIGEVRFDREIGDAVFIAPKVPHNFEEFAEDFATWAIFFQALISDRFLTLRNPESRY